MSSSLRRGTLAATTLALAAVTLTACGAGNNAQTLEVKPDNAATHVGTIKLQNINLVTDTEGSGAGTVTGRVFNDGKKDQTLKAITLAGSGERAKLSPAKGEKALTVPAGGSLALGGKNHAEALFPDAAAAGVKDGNAQAVTFDLSSTGAVKIRATVVAAKGAYKKTGPTEQPSEGPQSGASTSPGDAESPGGKPSEGEKAGNGQQGQDGQDSQSGQESRKQGGSGAQSTQSPGAQDAQGADEQGAHAGH